MKKNKYTYIIGSQFFNTNYDLLESQGIVLEKEHSEANAYNAFGKIGGFKGEWLGDDHGAVNGIPVYRVKKNRLSNLIKLL